MAAEVRALAAAARPIDAERALSAVSVLVESRSRTPPDLGSGSYFAEATTGDLRYEVALAADALASAHPDRSPAAVTHVDRCLEDPTLSPVRRARVTAKLARVRTRSGDLERGLAATDHAVRLAAAAGRSRLLDVDLANLNSALTAHPARTVPQRQRLAALIGAVV